MAAERVIMTAVAGGIGCGKSVVSRMLRLLGYEVYDCDSRAKSIMDGSSAIMARLAHEISSDVIETGADGMQVINRRRLADIVFNDGDALARLNAIVHSAVKDDILRWKTSLAQSVLRGPLHLFVETAILVESGLDRMVDNVWEVSAPLETRIERAMMRDNAPRHLIEARIRSQRSLSDCDGVMAPDIRVDRIVNDDFRPLLPQIFALLGQEALG